MLLYIDRNYQLKEEENISLMGKISEELESRTKL
jgi:hypothetical protein